MQANEFWRQVWHILQEECGAGYDRFGFITKQGGFREWRFQGALGFGGKLYNEPEGLRVDCYPEDMNPERKAMIERANKRLELLMGKAYESVMESND